MSVGVHVYGALWRDKICVFMCGCVLRVFLCVVCCSVLKYDVLRCSVLQFVAACSSSSCVSVFLCKGIGV